MAKIENYWDFADETQGIINNLPVVISLQYRNKFLKFQVNPESIRRSIPSESTKTRIESLGEVSTQSKPGLSTINISSFFWQDRNMVASDLYINWLKQWQSSKLPAKLIVTRLNYSMYVTCESFEYETRAGEENDIYFDLQLLEYRRFGAKRLNIANKLNIFENVLKINDSLISPILIDIPRPSRLRNLKVIFNPYKTKKGDTIISVTKKVRGTSSGWKELYDLNKSVLGDLIEEEIPTGTKLQLPEGWGGIKN